MAIIKPGQIVLFRFPQTDLTTGKLRPALLLKELSGGYGDWITCMISTKTGRELIDLDDIIEVTDSDFIKTGLKSQSVVRVSRLAVVSHKELIGTIGEISLERLERIKHNLSNWIKK